MAERGNGGIIGPANVPTTLKASGLWTLEEQYLAQANNNWPNNLVQRSLRFNSADSAYLNRTPASAGNRRTWTWSAWVKKALVADNNPMLFTAGSGSPYDQLYFDTNDKLNWYTLGVQVLLTNAVFRDPSAWYHIVLSVDTTQAAGADRVKLYVNSVLQTFSTYNAPSINQDTATNSTVAHNIGRLPSALYYLNGYMTEVNFIDGQALTPSSFGQTNPDTGVWEPKPYAGTYGTNGFYLNFSDNSNTTATTLGKDYSGNGNNWTPNNFSVCAGAGNDSLVDVPTPWGTDTGVGGTVRGNYCTLSPITVSGQGIGTLANGNLDVSGTSTSWTGCVSTIAASTGKWYFEATPTVDGTRVAAGIINAASLSGAVGNQYGFAQVSDAWFRSNQSVTGNASVLVTGLTQITNNDVVMVAVDFDAGKLWFGRNGTWDSSGNPATGANPTITFTTDSKSFYAAVQGYSNTGAWSAVSNFGQRPFAYTAPSGFKALCTQNLPTPTIGATAATQAGKYFNAVIYTPTSYPAVTTGVGFQPDFTWWKNRVRAEGHILFDVLRGSNLFLRSNTTAADDTQTNGWVANSDGWTSSSGSYTLNEAYVAWNWKANGAGVTNTAGSITSTVSANTTSGFSVVTYTGNGTGGATIGHGLSAAPRMIIVKARNTAGLSWLVYHQSIGATQFLLLNTTDGVSTNSAAWNNTAPTSTVFTAGTGSSVNGSGTTYVAYCFAEVPGFSKFGSYTGNGSSDGPFVYCGFRPKYVMTKRSDAAGENWHILDTVRNTFNVEDKLLYPNLANAEGTFSTLDITSNGFKLRNSDVGFNASGGTYIFAAFAEAPQKFALAR